MAAAVGPNRAMQPSTGTWILSSVKEITYLLHATIAQRVNTSQAPSGYFAYDRMSI